MEQLKDSKFVATVPLPESPKQLPRLPNAKIQYPKWFGGSASLFAVVFSHPLDLIKVRHQTAAGAKQSITSTVISVVRIEGIKGLYRGLSASMLRQLTYGSTRFAIYESLKDRALANTKGDKLPMAFLLSASTFSGACGAIVGNPADIANVRMQNDRSLPDNLRKNYRSIFDVLARMAREEGAGGFVRGIIPNAIRSGCMTGCQLGSYDWFKDMLEKVPGMGNGGMATQFSASVLAGLVATTLCNPIDVVKTRIMSGNFNGMSVMKTVTEMTRTDGLRWMLRGWLPSFSRLGPHTVATLLLLEQHKKLYRQLNKRE
ncbi:unnamed protein product [Clonostachys rhizophaga]|uniref:Mitochondrial dicarboxylate transporter n=1 Tax=Clonostachys rhizophaga TaxID=160324 RepID=A0A9N9V7M8_9HYPO|nr:unnamed protein product [Clonostachys rhizophaga]